MCPSFYNAGGVGPFNYLDGNAKNQDVTKPVSLLGRNLHDGCWQIVIKGRILDHN